MEEADWATGKVDWAAEEAQVEAEEAHEAVERKRKQPFAAALPVAHATPAAAAAAPAEAHEQRSKKSLATARQYLALLAMSPLFTAACFLAKDLESLRTYHEVVPVVLTACDG